MCGTNACATKACATKACATKAWIGNGNGEGVAERLPQSDGEREPSEAASGNQDIKASTRHSSKPALTLDASQKPRGQKHAAVIINSTLTDLLPGIVNRDALIRIANDRLDPAGRSRMQPKKSIGPPAANRQKETHALETPWLPPFRT
jgi:hypothetical protein